MKSDSGGHIMKLYIKPLMGIIASVFCVFDANAVIRPCPEGCFCVNSGQFNPIVNGLDWYSGHCLNIHSTSPSDLLLTNCIGEHIISNDHNYYSVYYTDEFSEIYRDAILGVYGFIGNEFVYANKCIPNNGVLYDGIFSCPYSHPYSEAGASIVTQCFKYDVNGNKIYYRYEQTITCTEGTYLPANATSCIACQPSKNQVCPGGTFAKSDKVQGLKVFCVSGQYLNANAIQCSQCDDARYLCPGGLYNVDAEEHGRIKHNGYININNYGISKKVSSIAAHKFVTCNPGNYMPANSKECATCFGNYACPGGLFYTDVIYNEPRGLVACGYGYPNADRTQCVMQSSSPSFMKKKVSGNISTADTVTTDTPVKQAIEKKVSDAKVIIPTTSRSVIARPEVVPMEYDEPVPVHKRVNVHRAAKVMPQTAKTIQSEIIRERPGVKRPSKRK